MKSNVTIKDTGQTVVDVNPSKKDVIMYNGALYVVYEVLSEDGVLAFNIAEGSKFLLTSDMHIEIVDIHIKVLRRAS